MKAELAHHPPVSVIFEGGTHQGEALAVLVRFVNEDFEIVQRLVRLHVEAKSLSANELARQIITILCTGLQIPASTVMCAIRDGASVNGAAVRTMKEVMFPSMMNIIYVSHTLENVGRHMETHRFSTIFSNGGLHYLRTAQRLSTSGRRRLPMLSRVTVAQGGGPGGRYLFSWMSTLPLFYHSSAGWSTHPPSVVTYRVCLRMTNSARRCNSNLRSLLMLEIRLLPEHTVLKEVEKPLVLPIALFKRYQ